MEATAEQILIHQLQQNYALLERNYVALTQRISELELTVSKLLPQADDGPDLSPGGSE